MLPDRVSNPGHVTYESGATRPGPYFLRKSILFFNLTFLCSFLFQIICKIIELEHVSYVVNFSVSNTAGSFTTVVSNSFLSPLKKSHSCRFGIF